jgi:outer membrane protein assembly factor BamB
MTTFPINVNRENQRHCWLIALIAFELMAFSLVAEEPDAPKSWPNWLGPNRDGISHETGWNTAWPADGLPVVWSTEIGIGFSSISIADGRLFTMGHVDGKEIVWCLDAQSGKEIWNHRYPCGLNDNLHEGGPAATPTIDGDFVYTLGKEGQLYCLDFKTGKVLWRVLLQDDLDVPLPEWGFSSSPVIVGNQLLLEGGRVVSYDKITGTKNWQTSKHDAGYGSASVFQLDQDTFFVATLDNEGLRITKLDNGEEIAFKSWPSPFRTNSTTPIVEGNQIYISSAYNVGCGMFEFDGRELQNVYEKRQMRNHFNNSILWDGYLYGVDGNSNLGRVVMLTCMNLKTGDVAWKQQGMGCGSLMIADGKLLILTEKGVLVLAKATPAGYEELARSNFLTGRCWTIPVLFEKRIYGRNATGKLVCAEIPN